VRTTITLDPDVAALIKQTMARRRISFKQAVNEAIKAGLTGGRASQPFETPTFRMGKPAVPLTHALRLAAEMEDEEIVRELAQRK
jgi:hypothetical protein